MANEKLSKFFHLSPELAIAALGIVCIFFLTSYALFQGVDGIMFGSAMAGIGGIVGWVFKGYTEHKQHV